MSHQNENNKPDNLSEPPPTSTSDKPAEAVQEQPKAVESPTKK
jgi:hypothetical protein